LRAFLRRPAQILGQRAVGQRFLLKHGQARRAASGRNARYASWLSANAGFASRYETGIGDHTVSAIMPRED
jgi:hypothetical protein